MKWLTIELIKAHCRIDCDCENELLEMYGNSAEQQVLNDIERTYDDLIASYGEVPGPIVEASLMLVDFSYQQRTMASTMQWSPVPYTYEFKIKNYKRLAYPEYSNTTTEG